MTGANLLRTTEGLGVVTIHRSNFPLSWHLCGHNHRLDIIFQNNIKGYQLLEASSIEPLLLKCRMVLSFTGKAVSQLCNRLLNSLILIGKWCFLSQLIQQLSTNHLVQHYLL